MRLRTFFYAAAAGVVTLHPVNALVVSGSVAAAETTSADGMTSGSPLPAMEVERISPAELKRLMDGGTGVVVVDTCGELAYGRGHIPGAISFPWRETVGEPVDLPRNRLLVLYCDCSDEAASLDVARQLIRDWGYRNVKVLQSGIAGWIRQGYPFQGAQGERIRCE